MRKLYSFLLFSVALLFCAFFIPITAIGANYSFKSVRTERISYDPAYFNLGTFNDIIAAAIITDLTSSEAASINHTVKWTPTGGSEQEKVLDYEGEYPSGQWFLTVLAHDVEASSFSVWEEINYDFYINDILQSPPVNVSSGSFRELTIPTATYDPSTHTVTWQAAESRNYKVRILGSTYQDDILFDSETIIDNETYQFTDQSAINLLDAGAILAIEAREFKSSSEVLNISIYITKTKKEVLYDDFSDPEFNSNGQWRIVERGDVNAYSATHDGGRLRLTLTSDSTDRTQISLRLPHPIKLRKSIRAKMSLISANSRSGLILWGELLNVKRPPSKTFSNDGNVLVQIFIENQKGVYRAGMAAEVMDANGDAESELIPWEIVDTNVQIGVQYPMSISFEASTKTITLMFGTTQRQYTFDESVEIFALSTCQAAGVRFDIYTRDDAGTKVIIGEVDDVWVSENYDPIVCAKPPNVAPNFLLLD